jgi:hypothetical protein
MPFERSPMRMLAIKQLTETFGDLLSVRASIGDHERLMVEDVFEQIFFRADSDLAPWRQRVRAAHHFLDKGSLENPRGVAERFLNCAELLGMTLNAARDAKREISESKSAVSEAALRRKLGYYKDLLEGPYRVLLAPIAYSFSRAMRNSDADFIPTPDGKAKFAVLSKIERLTVYPQSQFAHGVNTHVRNAYSHSNYRILNADEVELWDPAPARKGKAPAMWGPERWSGQKLDLLLEDLELTVLAFVLAVTIYAINNRQLIIARGWTRTLSRPKLSERELRVSVQFMAQELGFRAKSFVIKNGSVEIVFKTSHPGISQNAEILMGGENWGRRLIQKVEYIDVPVVQQLLGLFQRTSLFWEGYSSIAVSVFDPSDSPIGAIALPADAVLKLEGPTKMSVESARKLFTVDSLGDANMSVRIEHSPRDP